MTIEYGRYGIWRLENQLGPELAKEIERLGFGTVWIGGSPGADLCVAESMLDATDRLTVATGIVNVWRTPADDVAPSYHRIAERHPDRFLLGVGAGHPEHTSDYTRPYAAVVEYLDRLDALDVPVAGRALAALGPKVMKLAGERTAGAHPYLTTPEHTRQSREILGAGPLLAPEQRFVLDEDPARARERGRSSVSFYLGLRNYVGNLERLGFADPDFADGGSDALVDALVAHGSPDRVAARLTEHLDAGADHVCAQVLTAEGADPVPDLRRLSEALGLA